jgi:hypothetical protein
MLRMTYLRKFQNGITNAWLRLVSPFTSEPIHLIEDDQIEEFLENAGILNRVKDRDEKCIGCGEPISISNFGGAVFDGETPKLFCNHYGCVEQSSEE